jgi:membrane protein
MPHDEYEDVKSRIIGPQAASAGSTQPPKSSFRVLLGQIFSDAAADRVPRMGAALAFYGVFSLAPLLIVAIGIVGLIYGDAAANGQLHEQLRSYLGDQGAKGLEELVANARRPTSGLIATIGGFCLLIYFASTVLIELKDSLNQMWHVESKETNGIVTILFDRLWSFLIVIGIALWLLLSVGLSTLLHDSSEVAAMFVHVPTILLQLAGELLSFLISMGFVAMIFKYLPDAKIAWGDVWIGAAATSLLLTVTKFLFGLYLRYAAITSTYGAVASLVIVLLWVYYSAQILLLGGEFTRAYACMFGSCIERAPTNTLADRFIR